MHASLRQVSVAVQTVSRSDSLEMDLNGTENRSKCGIVRRAYEVDDSQKCVKEMRRDHRNERRDDEFLTPRRILVNH